MVGGEKREGMGNTIAQYHLCNMKYLYSTVNFSSTNEYLNAHTTVGLEEYVWKILTGAYRGKKVQLRKLGKRKNH